MKLFIAALLITLSFSTPSLATLPGLVDVGNGEVNYLHFIKVYEANLFVKPDTPQSVILDQRTSRCLVLKYAVSLSAADIIAGAEAILKKQHSQEELEKVQPNINTIHNAYTNVQNGDSYALCYDSALQETTLLFNEEEVATTVSANFARIYFGIWLGDANVIDTSLKNDLLKQLPKP